MFVFKAECSGRHGQTAEMSGSSCDHLEQEASLVNRRSHLSEMNSHHGTEILRAS